MTPTGVRFYEQSFEHLSEQEEQKVKAKGICYWKKQEREPEAKKIETLAEYLSVDPGEIEIPAQRAGDNRIDWRGEHYLVLSKGESKKLKYLNGHIICRMNE